MAIGTWLQSIAVMKDGYNFGECWQYKKGSSVAVIPILRKTDLKRSYCLLNETEKVEVIDSGIIDKVIVKNHESQPLFIRLGEVFAGKTQERMAIRSYVVMPDSVASLDVRCIHSTRHIEKGEPMKTGVLVTGELEKINYQAFTFGQKPDQRETWNTTVEESERISRSASSLSARATTASSATSSSTSTTGGGYSADNVKAHIDAFNELLKDIIEELPVLEDQVGVAFHSVEQVMGLELFDHCASWKAMKAAILYKEGANISRVEEDNIFGFSRENIIANVKKVLTEDYEETVVHESEGYRVLSLKSEAYLGEVTELAGDIVHLSIVSI